MAEARSHTSSRKPSAAEAARARAKGAPSDAPEVLRDPKKARGQAPADRNSGMAEGSGAD